MATPTAASRRPAVTSPCGGGGDGHGHRHAAVLAIGTANPASWVTQGEYVDWYFRVTNSEHLADLKAKMKRICKYFVHSYVKTEGCIITTFKFDVC